jgi:restriction system protein
MAIPDYQSIMLPLLRLSADGEEHSLTEAVTVLADQFGLTVEERSVMLPSGQQAVFTNRTGWARTYLKKAAMLETTRRGFFKITRRGIDYLKGGPAELTVKTLEQFPEFVEFKSGKAKLVESLTDADESPDKTPEELLDAVYQGLRQNLATELLQTIKSCSPEFFEKLVIDLLVRMGYGGTRKDAGAAIGKRGDEGIDGIIKEDRLGLDAIYVQAKRWENPVGRPEVQKFAGALQGQRARKGVFITTSMFTAEATDFVSRIESKIVLIDGNLLANLMIDHNVGVAPMTVYELKRIDSDYFAEE